MGKRKQPFGYKMEFGDIVPEPEEAETVRSIYLKYLAGASFKVLAEALDFSETQRQPDFTLEFVGSASTLSQPNAIRQ